VDGLPLTKSSCSTFWPILGYIFPFNKSVFPIGIYWENEKPADSNQFMNDFINEIKFLTENGIELNSIMKKVSIFVFSCDTPAKSFLLKTKGHSGFNSCNRCVQEGDYINNRVCFPFQKDPSTKRTHENYVNKTYDDHHVSNEISNIFQIPNIDIVKIFALDYMHIICLGIVKKLIVFWIYKGPLNVRLSSRQANTITELLLKLKPCITCDFSRKPREVESIHRWKATEMRQFLLYTGQFVLKNILTDECYMNFLSLSIAMIILLSPDKNNFKKFAKDLLEYFVESFQLIYGKHYVSYNIHSILHLVDDYEQFGPLDNCSAFCFENYMKNLKSMVRKHEKPLEQVVKRYNEICLNKSNPIKSKDFFKNQHFMGPLTSNTTDPQYKVLNLDNFTVKITNDADCYILTNDNTIIKILNIAHLKCSKATIIIGKPFLVAQNMYEKPIKSSKLDIYKVQQLSDSLKVIALSDIKKKMMLFPLDENAFMASPIIHSDPSSKNL